MADVSKRLGFGVMNIAGGGGGVYTVPSGKKTFIKSMTICNITSVEGKFSVSIYPHVSGGISYNLVSDYLLKGNDTITIPFLDQILEEEDVLAIYKSNSTSYFNFYVSGREVDV
ncbi:hypothetical protein D3C77_238770 [compost metagenome]